MKRRFICIILAVLILSLSGCTNKNKAAVTVDGESISEGVYAYYLDKIMSSPKEYGVDLKNKEKVEKVALSLCAESVAVSRLIKENRLSLSQLSKSSVAENTEKIWGLFGSYYEPEPVEVGKATDELKLSPCACLQVELPKTLPDWFVETI